MKADFVVVADASPEIGMGHAVRMYALAEAFMRTGKSVVYATRTQQHICGRLALPCPIVSLKPGSPSPLRDVGACIYDIPPHMRPAIQPAPSRTEVWFEDYQGRAERAIVVNPHFGAASYEYGPASLLGVRWLPLRKEFVQSEEEWQRRNDNQRDYERVRRGIYLRADTPERITIPTARKCDVMFQEWNKNALLTMQSADIAVVTASMTAYECMALGLPTLVYPQSDHHQPIADSMVKAGVALHYSEENLDRVLNDASLRRRLGETARTVVDGRGADRLARALIGMF